MKKLVLVMKCANYGCHNGDLITCKEYVRQIYNELKDKIEIKYWHECHPKVLKDLEIPTLQLDLNKEEIQKPYLEKNQTLYINLWRAQREEFSGKVGVNHEFLQRAFRGIFERINSTFNVDLKIKSIQEYVPLIDFSFFKNSTLDQYISKSKNKKKILISNGPALSGQSFPDTMEDAISNLAAYYSEIDFICTTKFKNKLQNIIFTDDIIEQTDIVVKSDNKKSICDLNEISYLSTFCDIIVGKNSGPFIYCLTKNNLYDKNKSILSFHKRPTDDMTLYTDYQCDYKFHQIKNNSYCPIRIGTILKQKIEQKYG